MKDERELWIYWVMKDRGVTRQMAENYLLNDIPLPPSKHTYSTQFREKFEQQLRDIEVEIKNLQNLNLNYLQTKPTSLAAAEAILWPIYTMANILMFG